MNYIIHTFIVITTFNGHIVLHSHIVSHRRFRFIGIVLNPGNIKVIKTDINL